MSAERPSLPPVRLHTEAELARDALAAPLLARAARLARWAGPATRVGAGGELAESQLPAAAEHLGLAGDEDGAAYASEAWRLAVDTGLVDVQDPQDEDGLGDGDEAGGTVTAGENLALLTGVPRRTSSGSGSTAWTPYTPTPPRRPSTTSPISSTRTAAWTSTPWTGTRRPRRSSWTGCSATSTC